MSDIEWSEPGYNVPSASDDERLSELAFQSERLAGKHEPKRSVKLLEDDVRYLIQENTERDADLDKWERWYESAPEEGDPVSYWTAWYGQAPCRQP